jgi:hypothetical protein
MSGVLTLADFKTIADSVAHQVADLQSAITSTGWGNNRATILAEADLIAAAPLALAFGNDPVFSIPSAYASRLTALRAALGDLSSYLLANDSRVHPNWNTILLAALNPKCIFPPVMSGGSKLASFAATGATAGTFTPGTPIDLTKYGKAWITLHMTKTGVDKRVVRRERGEDAVRVVEGVLQIFNQFGLGFRRVVATLFAVTGRFLALKFVEEGELGAGDVLHLFPEAADAVELAD